MENKLQNYIQKHILRHLTKSLILFFSVTLFTSCFVDDDTNEICTEDCTEFKGQLRTEDGRPIAGADINLEYTSSHIFLSAVRRIATTTTDKNGFYKILAFLRDNEIEKGSNGNLGLYFDVNQISNALPNNYLKPKTTFTSNGRVIDAFKAKVFFHQIYNRDTILENDFIAPMKGKIQIKIDDFTPIVENDYFYATIIYDYSFLNPVWEFRQSRDYNSIRLINKTSNFVFNYETILNGDTRINIQKSKNGITTYSDTIIKLSSPNLTTIELKY
ncbi:carboxypeptidase-like regulatory domain-containing protein [Polaribacter sp.]|uniref:carboxypeptidase-like regulatory domain-containing protein n=1 Tax=Polaribacter sp. TaxID=1920175 RepID=UPI003F6A7251